MHKYSKIILALVTSTFLAGCNQIKQNKGTDEKAIRDAIQSYQEAYNRHDADKLREYWASDAIYFNPVTGESAEGREAISKLLKEKFAQDKGRHVEIEIKNIEFPNENEAIVNGLMKAAKSDQPALNAAYQVRYVKENGKWLLDSIDEIELQEPPSNFEQLKKIAWLVGKWEDSDDNVQILFDSQWDKYKNFITQNFSMKVYGQDDIEGKQIIAWDPVKNTIRSWVFDSDGGFGEGTWDESEKSWYASMRYTLGDGRIASSKNVYTPIDDHSYTFASVDREVDGEILPNMDPVTVEKID